ncbi:MAG: hypothetical protein Q7R70_05030 [Candidatus Diapherotrites archaeon]|nr:hypothetical protein [Candidatus Diapherotrites archaeon]
MPKKPAKIAKPIQQQPKKRFFKRALVTGGVIAGLTLGGITALKNSALREKIEFKRAEISAIRAEKKGQFSIGFWANSKKPEQLSKTVNYALGFLQKELPAELNGKKVSVYLVNELPKTGFTESYDLALAKAKTPKRFVDTPVNFVPGETPAFNVHLNLQEVTNSLGKLASVERINARSFGLIFNQVAGTAIIFEKNRSIIDRRYATTSEMRHELELKTFEKGIGALSRFAQNRPKNSRFRQNLELEVKFQQGLLESWKRF